MAEPLMEVAAHCVPNPLKAGKVETIQRSQPQLPQAAVEMSVQYPAGCSADQGNVRGLRSRPLLQQSVQRLCCGSH